MKITMETGLVCTTGFWKERLRILEEDIPEEGYDPDDFSEFGFGFMENETDAFSDEDHERWADMLSKANKSVDNCMAMSVVSRFTPHCFLHGDCNIFAQYLHKKYGYRVEAVFEDCGDGEKPKLVHMYCKYEPEPGYKVYVDVRGKCNDFDLFMKEFYDNGLWGNDNYTVIREYDDIPEDCRTDEEDLWRLEAAEKTDAVYGYYDPYAG